MPVDFSQDPNPDALLCERGDQRCELKTFEFQRSASGGLRCALLGDLRCAATTLRALRGIVRPLPCPVRAELLLALAQRGHLRVNLLDLRVHDLADQHGRCTRIASSAAKMAASTASRSRSRCFGVMAAVIRWVFIALFSASA